MWQQKGIIYRRKKQNKTKAAVIIEGPEAELNSKDENSPINTDNKPPNIDSLTI